MRIDIWKKEFDSIIIAIKFFGLYFEFWIENRNSGENCSDFLKKVKEKYMSKYPQRDIRLRFVYESYTYTIKSSK